MTSQNDTFLQRWMPRIAAAWLLFVLAYGFGYLSYKNKIWPFSVMEAAGEFLGDESGDTATVTEKILNDFDLKPSRHMLELERDFQIPEHYQALEGLRLKKRRRAPLMYLDETAPEFYRFLYGVFDFAEGFHGAILLNPEGEVQQTWIVRQEDAPWANRKDPNVFPHGVELLPDGSLIAAFDSGSSITRYGYCGEQIWRIKGRWHHSITRDGQGGVWVWGNPHGELKNSEYMIQVDEVTGTILNAFDLDSVMEKNPDIDPFAIRQEDQKEGSSWVWDRLHPNDVDPLPAALADRYEQFDAGDLLISLRSVNLVAVIDPVSQKVKWWRQGLVRRQHDPDWNERGTITIYDNNMHRDYSRIVEIDPVSFASEIVLDGKDYEFYSWRRGKHEVMPAGGYLITSSEQGRVFETDADGEIVFEFVNQFSDERRNLVVSEARYFDTNYFNKLPVCSK